MYELFSEILTDACALADAYGDDVEVQLATMTADEFFAAGDAVGLALSDWERLETREQALEKLRAFLDTTLAGL